MYGREREKKISIKCTEQDKQFPIEILNQWDITELEIIGGNFSYFPEDITILKYLKKLTLVSTKIKRIPSELFDLTELRYLNLKNNEIESLPKLRKIHLLEHLNLGRNRLKNDSIDEFLYWLPHLNTLDFGHNDIRLFPMSIINLAELNRLNLENNKLKEIPEEIKSMKSLRHISLGNNPFPSEIKLKLEREFNLNI